jgi:ubiquinone/menaquinone biosynthesis C-methylase UbiE
MGDVKPPSVTEMRKRKFAYQIETTHENGSVADSFFENYSNNQSYEDVFEDAFNGKYLIDLIKAVWGAEPHYRLLDCGSANGLTIGKFEKLGVEAWGIENSAHIHSKTPEEWRERNLLGDVCKMPFEDGAFDFPYVTRLPHLPEEIIGLAIKELFRVCRVGVLLQGVTTDMTEEVIEDYELFKGLQTFWTCSEWSDAMVGAGFRLTVSDPVLLDEVWRIEQATDEDDWDWYPNKETMRYHFFSKPQIE